MTDPFPWLPPPAEGADPDDDPWGEVELPEVVLTTEQEDFLTAFREQPVVPRVRHVGDPFARFEEDQDPSG